MNKMKMLNRVGKGYEAAMGSLWRSTYVEWVGRSI